MSDHEFINRGDRVRITIEGVHDGTLPNVTGTYGADRDFEVESEYADTITVELVERPITQFKPGQFVREKDEMGRIFYLAKNGYVVVGGGGAPFWEYDEIAGYRSDFTSEDYELVNLVEAPF